MQFPAGLCKQCDIVHTQPSDCTHAQRFQQPGATGLLPALCQYPFCGGDRTTHITKYCPHLNAVCFMCWCRGHSWGQENSPGCRSVAGEAAYQQFRDVGYATGVPRTHQHSKVGLAAEFVPIIRITTCIQVGAGYYRKCLEHLVKTNVPATNRYEFIRDQDRDIEYHTR